MALSDDQIVNIWGREPRYHAAPIGSTDIAFARDIEAEVRKQDEALIRQMLEALSLPCDRWNGTQSRIVREAINAGRAWLEAKK